MSKTIDFLHNLLFLTAIFTGPFSMHFLLTALIYHPSHLMASHPKLPLFFCYMSFLLGEYARVHVRILQHYLTAFFFYHYSQPTLFLLHIHFVHGAGDLFISDSHSHLTKPLFCYHSPSYIYFLQYQQPDYFVFLRFIKLPMTYFFILSSAILHPIIYQGLFFHAILHPIISNIFIFYSTNDARFYSYFQLAYFAYFSAPPIQL